MLKENKLCVRKKYQDLVLAKEEKWKTSGGKESLKVARRCYYRAERQLWKRHLKRIE